MKKCCCFLFIVVCMLSCKRESTYLYYNIPFEEITKMAKDRDQPFCVVLSRSFCPPCNFYLERIFADSGFYATHTLFNVVDTDIPENKWYQQWLGITATPVTAVFSPFGELLSVVEGDNASGHQCIREAILGNSHCATYTYNPPAIPRTNYRELMQQLNRVLVYRAKVNAGECVEDSLHVAEYPYSLYLQAVNAINNGQPEWVVACLERLLLLSESDQQSKRLYADLSLKIMLMTNPDYDPSSDALLCTDNVVIVDNCRANEPRYFSMVVENCGRKELVIDDVGLSCDCLVLLNDKLVKIKQGEAKMLDFMFQGDYRGIVKRSVTIYSNSLYDPVEDIEIQAIFKR